MNIVVSIGEAIDKLSILELKHRFITDAVRLREVAREIEELEQVGYYKDEVYYDCLVEVNEKIWKLTDVIKTMNYETSPEEFAKVAHQIFEYNQQRFRIKNIFNRAHNSCVKEQKSYGEKVATISAADDNVDIIQMTLEYDRIIVDNIDFFIKKVPFAVRAGVIMSRV